jgi:hypothetical protein
MRFAANLWISLDFTGCRKPPVDNFVENYASGTEKGPPR